MPKTRRNDFQRRAKNIFDVTPITRHKRISDNMRRRRLLHCGAGIVPADLIPESSFREIMGLDKAGAPSSRSSTVVLQKPAHSPVRTTSSFEDRKFFNGGAGKVASYVKCAAHVFRQAEQWSVTGTVVSQVIVCRIIIVVLVFINAKKLDDGFFLQILQYDALLGRPVL